MFKNYFSIALRNLWRNKGFSAITIFGLAIGMTTCLLITLFVTDELSYDRFNKKADRIYRINADFFVNGNAFKERYTPSQLGPVLQQEYPNVENYVRFIRQGNILVKKGTTTLVEKNACFADSTLFDVFSLQMISGDPKTALTQPHTMVISERMALKYFNSTDVVGKTLQTDNVATYQISGVIKDVPDQSHLHFDFVRALSELPESRENGGWMSDNYATYVLMREGATGAQLQSYVNAVTKKYMEAPLQKMTGSNFADLEKSGGHFGYNVLPLTKIHLYSPLADEAEPSGNIQYVYIFIAVAVIILLIACVNFMNLSTARSAGRAKEVGVRKVLGSQRSSLIFQFLTESTLTSFFALLLAVALAILLLPYLNQLSGKHITLEAGYFLWLLPSLLVTAGVIGLLAGSYPAFFLSGFEPIKVLKGRLNSGFKNGWLRNSLVVFQFASAILLIVGTLVINSQLNYIRNKKLGYNREQVLILGNTQSLWIHARNFKNEVLSMPGVESGTMTASLPTDMSLNTNIYSKDAARSAGQVTGVPEWYVDADYIHTMGMQMASGRNFSPTMPSDTFAVLLNETAARLFGFNDLNEKYLYADGSRPLKVIGVVKDFNAGSLRNKIPPMVFRLRENPRVMAFRIHTGNIQGLMAKIKSAYEAQPGMSGQPFVYSFLDDDFNRLYIAEQRTGKIFISFAVLAVLIASLGVFGLITYAAEQRTREIGIRKVLGASVTGIVAMLSKDFLKLVLVAIVIASPLAWYMMSRWLQNFAYQVKMNWTIFVLAAFIAIAITILTVSYRAIRAATANPVNSLKAE
ncbi:ABC transporter permease [Chitinophaga ginsengisegetis]|uniref:ABC transporter permease n=1 Tax=Chitinophaga ginsengisegetis TaxID=393003 RepID=UPI000DBA8549|nr:ABC transporter permease [Chitinophaga ginsengisegetis]MDR6570514.1 putative ABC transport system permease protein [Chitinophaga ginsengisegetis]MDR6650248.1 putative ABC transport system permease protein [Chitinophaga ginsengisegetis]MDR6656633.1 putative ABC transport system permease protein [Chitinophaga ginsengisegetis]